MMASKAYGPPHADAATRRDAALACLDVLRGASVLVKQNEEVLMGLLAAQQSEEVGSQGHRDKMMLESLVDSLWRVLKGSPSIKPPQARSCQAERVSDEAVGAAEEWERRDEAAQSNTKRLRVDDPGRERGQEPQQQQHLFDSPSYTHVASIGAGQRLWTPVSTPTTATSIVPTSPDLLLHIVGYVGGGRGVLDSWREDLGSIALVCRAWRDAAQHETLWEPLAKELIPRLADAGYARTTQVELGRAGGSHRSYLLQYASVLRGRYVLSSSSWYRGLVLHFDIWTSRDQHPPFSGGDDIIHVGADDEGDDDDDECIIVGIGDIMVGECAGPPFSAASRSRPRRQYGSVREYLESLRTLKVRVTVHDERTGRRAVLWDDPLTPICQVRGPADDMYVRCGPQSVTTVSYGPATLDAMVCFRVMWLDHEDVYDDALPDDQKEFFTWWPCLSFTTDDHLEVGRFIWSALGY